MHELSIAQSLVQLVTEQVAAEELPQVRNIKLRIGALSCVHPDSLLFSFDLVTQDTPLGGVELIIETIPVVIYCAQCNSLETLPGIQSFRCPRCQQPSADIRAGRELDLEAIELEPQKAVS